MGRLANRPQVEVFAADRLEMDVPPAVDRYQGGIDRLSFAEYLLEVRPDAVIHLAPIDRKGSPGAVAGAQALFGAINRCGETKTVIVKSDTSVYGSGPRSPSVFSENDIPAHGKQLRYQRRLSELEAFVDEVAAAQPAAKYAILRFATIIGPTIGNAMSRYLRLPAVPVLAGFDPRLQFVYEQDAVRATLPALDFPL
ncbi:MAG: NAD-dependent epimerase/dehydratase family protein, partial [bacterium]|nr:NAD-dependent epimerase/dehydratase family protein [bacterium]